ncbi:hypothetical protein DFJ74DRAFT_693907 [Hyaloraphidium curvatum]|nr:hypothetical protein DFJ74DRAFT_693907 [Hyaloraphidium curvatum]
MTLYRAPQQQPQSVKEAEASSSFRIFEAVQALRDGKLPTNEQLLRMIDIVVGSETLERKKMDMSEDGSKFVDDLITFLEATKRVVEEKNADEDIQEFLFHARLAATSPVAAKTAQAGMGAAREAAGPIDPSEAFNKSMLVARLLITNSEFRNMVTELNDIGQDMMEGIRQKRSARQGGVSGSTSRADSSYTRAEGETIGVASGSGSQAQGMPSGGMATSTEDRPYKYFNPDEEEAPVPPTGGVAGTPARSTEAAKPFVTYSAYSSPTTGAGQSSSMLRDTSRRTTLVGDREAANGRPGGGQPNITADDLHEAIEERLTPERRTRLIERLRDVMIIVQDNSQYVEAIDFLLNSVGSLSSKVSKSTQGQGRTATGRKRRTDANVRAARHDLKHLLARFAGDQDIQPLLDAIKDFNAQLTDDFYLRDFMADVRLFLDRSLHERRYLDSPDYVRKGSDLLNRGRALLFEGYRQETQAILDETQRITTAFQEDSTTQEFGRSLKQLVNNFFFDQEGRLTFKDELARDFATVLLPIIVSQVRYIPIPRIEHNDENIHIIVENIILTSDNFLPNVMEIKLKNAAVVGLRSELASTASTSVTLNFYQIYADIRDVPFYFRKKTGFPRLSDHGVANIYLGGQGMSIILKLGMDLTSTQRTLWIRKCKTYVDDLRIEIRESRHDPLYRAAAPIIDGAVRKAIQTTVETQLRDWVGYLNDQVTSLKSAGAQQAESMGASQMGEAGLNKFLASIGVQSARKKEQAKQASQGSQRRIEGPSTSSNRMIEGSGSTYRESGGGGGRSYRYADEDEPTYESYIR